MDGSIVRINGLYHLTEKMGIEYWGYNPLILTFDPNFLQHPSSKGDTFCRQFMMETE